MRKIVIARTLNSELTIFPKSAYGREFLLDIKMTFMVLFRKFYRSLKKLTGQLTFGRDCRETIC